MRARLFLPLALAVAALASACATGDTDETGTGGTAGTSTGSAGTTGGAGTTGNAGNFGTGGSTVTGSAGTTGAAGRGGTPGTGGTTGAAGTTGIAGTIGTAGRGGTTGNAGATGTAGNAGATGAAGRGGTTGMGGNAGSIGNAGRGGTTGMGGMTGAAGRGGTTGGAGTGGTTGTGGQTSTAICNFASGLNIAWVSFANDVPSPNIATFNTIFKNTHDAGGRVIRWWFHTNGTKTPGYDSSGLAVKLPQSHIDGVKAILSAADSNGVGVNISLWSFDMLQSNAGNTYVQNQALLENDTNRQAYVDNYLTPLVNAIKGTPGLYSWEIFNEPEGMGPKGWATHRTTQAAIQKTVNWLAAAIHTADPAARVTSGSQTFDYCSNGISGKSNWYSDSALRAAGGKQNGTLDFYEVHYYDANESNAAGTALSPFGHPATYWGLDKKLVVGEFYAVTTDGVQTNDLYTNLYTSGYNGAWAWQYNDSGNTPTGTPIKWPSMQAAIQNVYNAHQSDVGGCK
jgi:hypothetical protein